MSSRINVSETNEISDIRFERFVYFQTFFRKAHETAEIATFPIKIVHLYVWIAAVDHLEIHKKHGSRTRLRKLALANHYVFCF